MPDIVEKLYFDGDSYFNDICKDLSRASSSIDIEFYIFNFDDLGQRILEHLLSAVNRKVQIRVLVDAFGSSQWSSDHIRQLILQGINVRIYNLWKCKWLGMLQHWMKALKMYNMRNHRKICIIDNRICYVGSMNISAVHLTEFSGTSAWRDTGVRTTSEDVIRQYRARFDKVWEKRRDEFFIRARNQSRLLNRIKAAKVRIWITNSYFVPVPHLLYALKQAAKRNGVDVRLILPKKSDVFFMNWISNLFYKSLLSSNVRIFEYLPTILHAKTIIIDNWAIVGTSNLNRRSILHDLETDLILQTDSAVSELATMFLEDLKCSHEVQLKDLKRFDIRLIWGKFFFNFRNWL